MGYRPHLYLPVFVTAPKPPTAPSVLQVRYSERAFLQRAHLPFIQVISPRAEAEGQEQGQEEPHSSGGNLPPSRQPDSPIPSAPIPILEFGMILKGQSEETVQERCQQAQIASRALSPAMGIACPEGGICVNVGDVTLLHVEGYRETASGPEYLFMGKMWLAAGAGVPFDLLRAYRREITRGDRLATPRIRKRANEEVDMVKATGCSTGKKVKRASS